MESENRQQEIRISPQLFESIIHTYNIVTKFRLRKYSVAHVYKWEWLANIVGIKLGLIKSKTREQHDTWNVFVRWNLSLPLSLGHVITGHMIIRDSWATLPRLGLRFQNTIPQHSDVIKACEASDITRIRDILNAKAVHPNDRTPDNMTVFRVRHTISIPITFSRD